MISFKSCTLLLVFVALFAFSGCSSKKEEPECEDPPAKAAKEKKADETKVERINLQTHKQLERKKNEWCRACVMSKIGFASCQKVYADEPGPIKDKDALKAKALEKACKDAGYPTGGCPDQALISSMCVGDELPKGTVAPGDAVQNLFKALNPPPEGKSVDNGPPDKKPEDKEKQPAKEDKPAAPVIE